MAGKASRWSDKRTPAHTKTQQTGIAAKRCRVCFADAGEFAALAAKRWFYYAREDSAVERLNDLEQAIGRNEQSEHAFLLVATAPWASRYQFLAVAYCRRTWCNHLVLDFLAVRPGLKFKKSTGYRCRHRRCDESRWNRELSTHGMPVGRSDRSLGTVLRKGFATLSGARPLPSRAEEAVAIELGVSGKNETASRRIRVSRTL